MASNQAFVDQLESVEEVTARKMFGANAIYANGKVFGLICENQLFVKLTKDGRVY